MAGFRTFATGEVLTSANVNDFLMKQSVMVFADATARTTALGAEVAEGMLTYNEDTEQLEVYDGTNFVLAAPEPPAGIGSNVVSTTKTDTFSTASASYVEVTGLTATITPSSATSKVLLLFSLPVGASNSFLTRRVMISVFRSTTNLIVPTSPGGRLSAFGEWNAHGLTNAERNYQLWTGHFLDSPATAAATTYSVRVAGTGGLTAFVNRPVEDQDNGGFSRGVATLTAIEVAA